MSKLPVHRVSRRQFLVSAGGATLASAMLACGKGTEVATPVPSAPTSANDTSKAPPEAQPTPTGRVITFNDYLPEHLNVVETIAVQVNFAGRPDHPFKLAEHWDKIFGTDDPIRQLNAYYHENFYGQLELRSVSAPSMGSQEYVEIELPGLPGDYSFGWLIGLESEQLDSIDLQATRHLLLEIVSRVVEKHPDLDFQDRFLFVVLNASGSEYGRGAAGFLPTGGIEPTYELFVGDVAEEELAAYADQNNFRVVDKARVVGVIDHSNYPFDAYFQGRELWQESDQFILGMALFGMDGPLSCASHDILHGLRRKSAYANPPEGRLRAVDCLYNLSMQSLWLVGTPEHGPCDRSINCSPYIGWWDPMADHLHPAHPGPGQLRDFFSGHPHGMCAFTKLRMGFIPDRCLVVAEEDDLTVSLAPLGLSTLPTAGKTEALAVKVPMLPGLENAAHIYLLLEYRRRVGSENGEVHPDNFSIDPDFVLGDKVYDPGYNTQNPVASRYINPPTQFVPSEGVLVYLVNEGIPELPGLPYTEWYNFVLALLNPAGNHQREDLTQAALGAGESIYVDFQNLYPDRAVPIGIEVKVDNLTNEHALVHISRKELS